jgi:hypothetical protein
MHHCEKKVHRKIWKEIGLGETLPVLLFYTYEMGWGLWRGDMGPHRRSAGATGLWPPPPKILF